MSAKLNLSQFLRIRAEQLAINLEQLLNNEDLENNVNWSANQWSNAKSEVQCAADAIIVRKTRANDYEILMIKRSFAPFKNGLALPGGLRDFGESLQQTAQREMEEETGISALECLNQRMLGEIESRDWDPRFAKGVNLVGVRFDVPENIHFKAGDDAESVHWVSVAELAHGVHQLAFVHSYWLMLAFKDEPSLVERFAVLTQVLRWRNQFIIHLVNQKRQEIFAEQAVLFDNLGDPNTPYQLK